MTSAREAKRAAAAAAAAARAAGTGWSGTIGPLAAIDRLIQPVVDANPGVLDEPKAVVKQAAIATQLLHGIGLQGASYDTWRNAAGMALLSVMRRYNHGLDRLPVIKPSTFDINENVAIWVFWLHAQKRTKKHVFSL